LPGLNDLISRFMVLTKSNLGSNTRTYPDITEQIEYRGLELLNADTDLAVARTLFSDDQPSGKPSTESKGKGTEATAPADWVASDTDAQLMLYIPFQTVIKIHSIEITSFADREEDEEDDDIPARPHKIELYINRSHNLGFDEAEGTPATQSVELSPSDWNPKTNTATIETRFVKFQNVTSLVLFVVDAQGEAEKTRIDRIRIKGEAGEKRAMGKLQKIGDEAD
jgi:hypothetical protein